MIRDGGTTFIIIKIVPSKSNAQLVARAVRIGKELRLEIASSEEAREVIKIGNYFGKETGYVER